MAKKITEDEIKWILSVNSSQAQQEIHKLTTANKDLIKSNKNYRDEQTKLIAAGKKESQEYKNLSKAIGDNNAKITHNQSLIKELEGTLSLTALTMSQLKKKAKELTIQLSQTSKSLNPQEYKKLEKELTAVRGRMDELKSSTKSVYTGLGSIKQILPTISLVGLIYGIKQAVDEANQMDDIYANVMKTTGLTRNEVVALNDDLKKMNTRTSREQLNALARDAGKLGIEGKKNILDFVDAGNQIRISLGEDLGDDAITQIGKMVGVYESATKELQNSNLKKQMLDVGSAVNQLGASSTANEQYLVSFAGRMGGIARQSGLAIDQVLGFGSALDQDMQQVEMSSTAFSNFIQKLMSDPAKFARMANLEVSQFTKLLQTDTNSAIKQVLRSLNEQGGFQKLLPIFNDMNLDGNRAVGVLSSMASSIDKIDAAQIIANQSLKEGLSITNEYNIKNNNRLAKLEIAKKNLKETALVLGETLSPLVTETTNIISVLFNALIKIPSSMKAILPWLLALTASYVSYNYSVILSTASTKKDIAWKKIQEVWTNRVAIAQKVLNLVVKQNPIAFAISLIAALVAGFVTWYNHSIKVQAVTQGLFASIKVTGKHLLDYWVGLWKIISGAATLNPKQMKSGIDQLKKSMTNWGDDVASSYQKAYDKRMKTVEKIKVTKKPSKTTTADNIDISSGGNNSDITGPTNKKGIEQYDTELLAAQIAEKKKVQSKEDLDKALLALEEKYLTKKRDLYKKDTAEYNGYESQLVDIARNKQLDANSAQLKIVEDGNKAKQQATDVYERTKRQELLDSLESGLLTQDQFSTASLALDSAVAERRLKDANDYAEIIRNATYNSEADKNQAVDAAQTAVDAAKDTLLKSQEAIEKEKQQAKKKKDEESEKQEKDHLDEVSKLRQELGLDKEKLSYQEGLNALKAKLKKTEATEKQSADAIARYKISKAQEYAEAASSLVNTVANFVTASNDAQAASLEAAKQKELTAVGDNADAREDIENKYAQKELDLKKKQADANMAIAIAQAIAEGALGVAKIWAVEGVNPIYAGILTALLVGITAMNIQSAVAQRNAIKSTTLSTSSSSSSSPGTLTASGLEDGGDIDVTRSQDGKRFRNALYDPERRGYIDRPTVIVGEGPSGASREWVASNDAVANPTIAPILSILDKHQQAGTIRTLDMNQVIRANMAGYASGGSIGKVSGVAASGAHNSSKVSDSSATMAILKELTDTINNLQKNGIAADVSLTDLERKQNLRKKARRIGSKNKKYADN